MDKDFKVMVMKDRLPRWRIWAGWRARPNLGYGSVAAALVGSGDAMAIGAAEIDEASATDRAIAVLPVELKRPVKLYYLAGLSVVDIAKAMHTSRPTVYNRLDDAYVRLYDALHRQPAYHAETRASA